MTFTKIHNKLDFSQYPLRFKSEDIERVDNFKYLGIQLDSNMDFKLQKEQMDIKLSRAIGIIRRLRRQVNLRMFKLLINAYVYSYFDECLIIWAIDVSFLAQVQVNINKLICDFFYPREMRVKGSLFRHCV